MISVSAKYTRTGEHLHSCYNFELMQLTFSSSSLRDVIERTEAVLGTGWTTWAMSNHDNVRVVTRCGRSVELQGDEPALAKLLLAALLSFRGGACVYQGEELGLTEAESISPICVIHGVSSSGPISRVATGVERRCHGLPSCRMEASVPPSHGCRSRRHIWPLAVNEQERDPCSVLHMFRRFLAWRKQHPALVDGDIAFVQSSDTDPGIRAVLER